MSNDIPTAPPRLCPTSGQPTKTIKVHIEVYPKYDTIWWHCAACGGWHIDDAIRRVTAEEKP